MKSQWRESFLYYMFFAIIIIFIIIYTMTYLKEQYQQSDPKLFQIKDNLRMLDPRANKLRIFEDNKSYTINKKRVYLCLKDHNNNYYPMNMLMYVAIHELAHVLCNEVGHTPKFQNIFKQLLSKAQSLGIYDPNIPVVRDYCGYNNHN
jgi:hypothetical protein